MSTASTAKKASIPQQLFWLFCAAAGVIIAATALYYFTTRGVMQHSTALTKNVTDKLSASYDLQERVSSDLVDHQQFVQQFFRFPDSNAVNAAVLKRRANQDELAKTIADCGPEATEIKTQFGTLVGLEQFVVGELLKDNAAVAGETNANAVGPQGAAVLSAIRKYHERVVTDGNNQSAVEKARIQSQVQFWLFTLVGLLALVLFGGWRLKTRINRELREVAVRLGEFSRSSADSAQLVLDSSQRLADGAGQQAASIQETSASLEELTSMTRRNTENAQNANDLAKQTRNAADQGSADIHAMSAAMQDIKHSSDDIAKIIRTIDEIAFQTNILALNAAVEAARAGEAGMGFAVVADEVRNLAQRSAQAAKETAAKIESAIGNTDRGVTISTTVARSLAEIVEKARKLDELAAEVATASREQANGITQINTAVGQMDKVTQSNASTAEESAAAAEQLNNQANSMKQIVSTLTQLVGGDGISNPVQAIERHSINAPQGKPVKTAFHPVIQPSGNSLSKNHASGNRHLPDARNTIPLEEGFRHF